MADADLNELRAQRRKARAALARAEAALGELRTANDIMESAINRLLKKAEGREPEADERERDGPLMRRYCKVILAHGGSMDGVWVGFNQIAGDMPDVPIKAIRRSLADGQERLVENEGDAYRLLESGMKLAVLP